MIVDDTEKCNLFNKYFIKEATLYVSKESAEQVVFSEIDGPDPNTLTDIMINENEIIAILNKLDPDKAIGIDKISNRVLKMCNRELSVSLAIIFRISLAS